MTCYNPVCAFIKQGPKKAIISWSASEGYKPIPLPCGRCIGCKQDRAINWAIRITHEAKMHKKNLFVTLTYDDEHISDLIKISNGSYKYSLNKRDIMLFIKRLRKWIARKRAESSARLSSLSREGGSGGPDRPTRYFQCGEYGEKGERPHHHIILFGFDPGDLKKLWNRDGTMLYRSNVIEKIWGKGIIAIGEVNIKSAMYVAGYACKGLTKELDEIDYEGRQKPFSTMSRRPGIGRSWYEKYKNDIYPHDQVITRDGLLRRPPRYYNSLKEAEDKLGYEKIKDRRREKINTALDRPSLKKMEEYQKYTTIQKKRENKL